MNSEEFTRLEEELEAYERDALRWRKMAALAFKYPMGTMIMMAPPGRDIDEVQKLLNEWADALEVPDRRQYPEEGTKLPHHRF